MFCRKAATAPPRSRVCTSAHRAVGTAQWLSQLKLTGEQLIMKLAIAGKSAVVLGAVTIQLVQVEVAFNNIKGDPAFFHQNPERIKTRGAHR